ncbi:MAG: peptidylprolyl isomerase [Steroidobacteraceae bacterium]
MNRMLATTCAIAIATLGVACTQKNAATTGDPKKSDNVAVVDGYAISRNTYTQYVNGISSTPAEKLTQQQRDALLENVVRGVILSNEAKKLGLDALDKERAALELQRLNVLAQAAQDHYLKDRKASEEELRAEYAMQVADLGKVEYRASHILVPTEEAAKQIIAKVKAGGNFAQLALKESMDPGSKGKGGDLDWLTLSAMPAAIGDALKTLEKGETAAAPVATEYGFHVIQLTDTRALVPPTYESVKERLEKLVENKKFKAHVDELTAKAKITRTL